MKSFVGLVILGVSILFGSFAFGVEDYPYGDVGNGDADIGKVVIQENTSSDSLIEKVYEAMGFGFGTNRPNGAIDYIKIVVNFFLGIVGFVATIVMIYSFYKMFTVDHFDEGYKHAREYVIKAFWALLIMGLSWLIVNWLFGIFLDHTGGYIN